MDKNTLYELIDKYLDGTASPQEKALLEEYYNRLEKMGTLNLSAEEKEALKEEMYHNIQSEISERKIIPLYQRSIFRVAAAAVILIFLAAGGYFVFFNRDNKQPIASNKQQVKDLPPGKNSAILTLANGKQIILDTAKGTIGKQGGTTVINLSGLLSYQSGENEGEVLYNTVTTARGNQYQLVLPDGSKVWLNSATTLHFPTLFKGNERIVDLDGEGYFEVAHNPSKPFHVQTGNQDVEVLGTHFNINSYKDEKDIKTTLFEGAVRVSKQGKITLLKPGEQAIADGAAITVNKDVDPDKILAWKNGWFEFDNTDLATIMRQVSRWYDVDIVYEGKPTSETYGGRISKNLPLSGVMHSLESNGIKFRLEGRKLYVNP